jgi:hypothetical protein
MRRSQCIVILYRPGFCFEFFLTSSIKRKSIFSEGKARLFPRNRHVVFHDVPDAFGVGKSGNSLGQKLECHLSPRRADIAELNYFHSDIRGLFRP